MRGRGLKRRRTNWARHLAWIGYLAAAAAVFLLLAKYVLGSLLGF